MIKVYPLSSNKQKILRKLQQKKYREQLGLYLCEGINLFSSAILSSKVNIKEIVLTRNLLNTKRGENILNTAQQEQIPTFVCDEETMRALAATVTPPGILFTIESHLKSLQDLAACDDHSIIYFEKVTDPGNLGTIIRTALWFGTNTIFLSPDCVDPYNTKTIRSSAGAIFNCDIYTQLSFETVEQIFKKRSYQFIATVPTRGIPLHDWKISQRKIIFFGSEAKGLSNKILQSADLLLTIYKIGNIESLNVAVAAGIILHEVALQSLRKDH